MMLAFLSLSLLFLRRRGDDSLFLDVAQTDQLKGIAIVLVIIGHLWYHVSESKAVPILGDYAVTAFLIISGFGMTISYTRKKLNNFFVLRFKRVVLPYWVVSILWLCMDWHILGKSYSVEQIIMTFLGLNFHPTLSRIDYVRWFITLLLIWYSLFYISHSFTKQRRAISLLCFLGVVMAVLKIKHLFPLGFAHQILGFPIGCVIGYYIVPLRRFISETNTLRLLSLVVPAFVAIEYCHVFVTGSGGGLLLGLIDILVTTAAPYFLFALLVLLLNVFNKVQSRFLSACGVLSYELYLLHCPLLVKYNVVFPHFDTFAVAFTLYICIVIVLSCVLKYLLKGMNKLA